MTHNDSKPLFGVAKTAFRHGKNTFRHDKTPNAWGYRDTARNHAWSSVR
jgi:hypothetical protein